MAWRGRYEAVYRFWERTGKGIRASKEPALMMRTRCEIDYSRSLAAAQSM